MCSFRSARFRTPGTPVPDSAEWWDRRSAQGATALPGGTPAGLPGGQGGRPRGGGGRRMPYRKAGNRGRSDRWESGEHDRQPSHRTSAGPR
ncbi:hypothetical protein EEZ25_14460 [Micromonospora aurantiaca]|nr:hypothetical protein EEZ25_14460 [Micromonospora aurantiaca]